MRDDLIGRIRRQQSESSKELSKQLFDELKPYVDNGKLSALAGYTLISEKDPQESQPYDRKTMRVILETELEVSVMASIKGYTDWLLCRMVRKGNYDVPSQNEIDLKTIEEKYHAPLETLKRTVNFIHSKANFPLLGEIRSGIFCPNVEELAEWKSFYDWNKP